MKNSLFCFPVLCMFVAFFLPGTGECQETVVRDTSELIVLQGAGGTEEYGELFSQWTERWIAAAQRGGLSPLRSIAGTQEEGVTQKAEFVKTLSSLEHDSSAPLWIVMIGHGTYDGREAKFNLDGPDLTAKELDDLLAPVTRTVIVINCASASAPFLEELSQSNRIVVTSTRSGDQVNFARFGDALSMAIGDSNADLDKDQQTSLLEAFLIASRKTLEFYEADGRIPTENALIDDNGDGKGTRANAFEGVRVVAQAEEAGRLLDGFQAHQFHLIPNDRDRKLPPEVLAQRNELEKQIELLRLRKREFEEDEYYSELEALFLKLARLLQNASAATDDVPSS